jgi:lysozyme family protein
MSAPVSDPVFDAAVAAVLAHEGGLSDDRSDPGGLTQWGFALRRNPDLTAAALRAMTRAEAVARYRTMWWDRYGFARLPPAVAIKLFDLAVPCGPGAAFRALQRACWAAGQRVREDGVLGGETVAAAGAVPQAALLAALKSELAAHFRALVTAEPRRQRFLAGWLARAYA